MLGPGVIWMALAQGSGELIWWPYLMAKYGLAFLFLLIPACLLQYPLNYEIGNYTLMTGESIVQGFIRLNRGVAIFLWILMSLSFLWFGAFASAGGTALASLTDFPPAWTARGQTLFWAYASIALFVSSLFVSRIIYTLIERVMTAVAVLTLLGLLFACIHPKVLVALPLFLKGIVLPPWPPPAWDRADSDKLLTAITFAGLGGFWTLFYSYWLREKGLGMAREMGHMTGLWGRKEKILETGFLAEVQETRTLSQWRRFLLTDIGIGIFGNLLTTLMTCLLAFALLHPEGLLPEGYQLAVVQSCFFEVQWGGIGRILFLFVAAAFLSDTWLATADGVSRMQTDFVYHLFPQAKRFSLRQWYYFFLVLLTVVTSVTLLFNEPGPLIVLSAVIGFVGTVIFSVAILFLNHRYLAKLLPKEARLGRRAAFWMGVTCLAYLLLAIGYLAVKVGSS